MVKLFKQKHKKMGKQRVLGSKKRRGNIKKKSNKIFFNTAKKDLKKTVKGAGKIGNKVMNGLQSPLMLMAVAGVAVVTILIVVK